MPIGGGLFCGGSLLGLRGGDVLMRQNGLDRLRVCLW